MKFVVLLLLFTLFAQHSLAGSRGRLLEILKHVQIAELKGEAGPCPEALKGAPDEIPLVLETERFRIAPLTRNDIPAASKILLDETLAKSTGDYLQEYQVAQLIASSAQTVRLAYPALMINFGIWKKQGNEELTGITQLAVTPAEAALEKKIIRAGKLWVEVSIHIDPKYWEKGVSAEVLPITTRFAFEKLGAHGLHARVLGSREKAQELLEILGFEVFGQRGSRLFYAVTKKTFFEKLEERAKAEKPPAPPASPAPSAPEPAPQEPANAPVNPKAKPEPQQPKVVHRRVTEIFRTFSTQTTLNVEYIAPETFFGNPELSAELKLVASQALSYYATRAFFQQPNDLINYQAKIGAIDHGFHVEFKGAKDPKKPHRVEYVVRLHPRNPFYAMLKHTFKIRVRRRTLNGRIVSVVRNLEQLQ